MKHLALSLAACLLTLPLAAEPGPADWKAQQAELLLRLNAVTVESLPTGRTLRWMEKGAQLLALELPAEQSQAQLSLSQVEGLTNQHPLYNQRKRIAERARKAGVAMVAVRERVNIAWRVSQKRQGLAVLLKRHASYSLDNKSYAAAAGILQELSSYRPSGSVVRRWRSMTLGEGSALSMLDVSDDAKTVLLYWGDKVAAFAGSAEPEATFTREEAATALFLDDEHVGLVSGDNKAACYDVDSERWVFQGLALPEGYNRVNAFLQRVDGKVRVVMVGDGEFEEVEP